MAIAFVSGSGDQGVAHASPLSSTQDCTGCSIIIAGVWSVGDVSSAATYAGVSMTALAAAFQYNTGEYLKLWYLYSPTTGSNTLSGTLSSSATSALRGIAFSGTATTGFPDAQHTASGASGTASDSVTTVVDNSIGVLFARFEAGNPTVSSNMTSSVVMGDTAGSFAIIGYSALKTPTGTLSMVATSSNTTQPWGDIMVSIAPPVSAPTSVFGTNRLLTGVGS